MSGHNCSWKGKIWNNEQCVVKKGKSQKEVQTVGDFAIQLVYCHDPTLHRYIFAAVCVVTQLAVENGKPLFEVEYDAINIAWIYC